MGCGCKRAPDKPIPKAQSWSDRTAERLKICADCDKLVNAHNLQKRCSVCGCFMEAKARIPASECPLGKW